MVASSLVGDGSFSNRWGQALTLPLAGFSPQLRKSRWLPLRQLRLGLLKVHPNLVFVRRSKPIGDDLNIRGEKPKGVW